MHVLHNTAVRTEEEGYLRKFHGSSEGYWTEKSGAYTSVRINPSILPMMAEDPLFVSEVLLVQEAMNESEVFVKFYADCRKKVDPNDIAAELRTKHLTMDNEHGEITNMMLSARVRMDHCDVCI
ncbi:hypothetical protein EMCRGX_G008662 [Ephydatia muelleri]